MSADAQRIRRELADPRTIAERLGLLEHSKRQPRGGLLVRCPAHGDKGPSLSLTVGSDGTLRVWCFGCHVAGDAFTLIAASHGLDPKRDFRSVFLLAAQIAHVDVQSGTSREGSDAPPPPPRCDSPPVMSIERFDAIARIILEAGPLAGDVADYLSRRGLLEQARADGWGALPPLATVASERSELAEAGLLLPSGSDWAHAWHRLVIPWRGLDGRIVTLQRRRLDGRDPRYVITRTSAYPYGIDGFAHAPASASVIFAEGACDVLAIRALARGPVVPIGLPGVEGWRPAWGEFARGRRAFIATDADEAGERAAEMIAGDLAGVASEVQRVKPSGAKDWAALLERRRATYIGT
jgi:DNA primase